MEEYRATFEIESKSDAYAVERVLERLYDSVREESRSSRKERSDSAEMLEQFKTVRESARHPKVGTLTVILQQQDDPFEERR